eukprot:TRINITY_DN4353_c0_g1_i1.p1 TRINITY_DN4353_c0_g1~~TRINITY_DN4353_c0_g1_i1.p1  ORF type:complete len:594 (+),score=217.80 TRINITY_DN4353_c0_g1_i1:47-1828(+)
MPLGTRPLLFSSQRRLRHVKGIMGRNLLPQQALTLLNTYFTLHIGIIHEFGELNVPFYTSEVVYDSMNPVWNTICHIKVTNSKGETDSVEIVDSDLHRETNFTVAVWSCLKEDSNNSNENDQLLGLAVVQMELLEYIGPSDSSRKFPTFQPNSIVIELVDGFYQVVGVSDSNQDPIEAQENSLNLSSNLNRISPNNIHSTNNGIQIPSKLSDSMSQLNMSNGSNREERNHLMGSFSGVGNNNEVPSSWSNYPNSFLSTSFLSPSGPRKLGSQTNLVTLAAKSQWIENSSKQKTAMSYSLAELIKLVSISRIALDLNDQQKILHQKINEHFERNQKYQERLRYFEILSARIANLKREIQIQNEELQKERNAALELRGAFLPQAHRLEKSEIVLLASKRILNDDLQILKSDSILCDQITNAVLLRTFTLLHQLRSIFPITVATQQNKGEQELLAINGFRLPNSDFTGCDEEVVATALGSVAHVVFMASKYLSIPLRYPITPMCSRSVIRDDILMHSSSPKFPLYSRGVDRGRFEYAVYLLNKNVEQLMLAQNLEVTNLRNTLPNVKALMNSLSEEKYKLSGESPLLRSSMGQAPD